MKKQNEELNDLNDLKDKENTNYKKYCRIAWEDFVYIKELKAEAVKWVKAFYEDMKKERPGVKREVIELNNYSSEEVVFWIKHFFNLTEEDLK